MIQIDLYSYCLYLGSIHPDSLPSSFLDSISFSLFHSGYYWSLSLGGGGLRPLIKNGDFREASPGVPSNPRNVTVAIRDIEQQDLIMTLYHTMTAGAISSAIFEPDIFFSSILPLIVWYSTYLRSSLRQSCRARYFFSPVITLG